MQNEAMCIAEENWQEKKKILVILAHPDDPEFFCGASIRRWTKLGHAVQYVLLTQGDKGGGKDVSPEALREIRKVEQDQAAKRLGVSKIQFLNFSDGLLIPDLELRRAIVAKIREIAPDVVVSGDPNNLFPRAGAINHPDHRAAGQAVIDAVFPAAGNYHYFPEMISQGLEPSRISELWLTMPASPNFILDVTEFWQDKIEALHCHQSQIGNRDEFDARMKNRFTPDSTLEHPRYEEKFYRIIFS
jgi:LmbE family N-acetylglucosaminyl deacetylase